jgi:CDP-glucose 4,6-dehydratase
VVNAASALPDPAFWCGRRVLVTGHTGFKGSWLALWLLELGAEVTGLSLAPAGEPNLFDQLGLVQTRLQHRIGDLNQPGLLEELVAQCRPEVVLHLAAQSLVRRGYREPLLTWQTNVIGTLQLLEALRQQTELCAAVCVTTDKVYENHDHPGAFREDDRLGGSDPYSSSKAAMEQAVASWRQSYCGDAPHQTPHLRLATARAGNVIGGGDWAEDRIVPDAMRALQAGTPIVVRQPAAIRPWQHVLEPLAGYLLLAERLLREPLNESAFNFGPPAADSRCVADVVGTLLQGWPGVWRAQTDLQAPAESGELRLNSDLARQVLGWQPRWAFEQALARTVGWYRAVHEGASPLACCRADLVSFQRSV